MLAMKSNHALLFDTNEARWKAVLTKDPDADGEFFFAVTTTRIYCCPSCSSRLPNQKNVVFFTSAGEAQAAGFRPCKRCRPDRLGERSEQEERILHACRQIEQSEDRLTLKEPAQSAGFSPHHFQRLFRRLVGVTPKQYAIQTRAEQLRAGLTGQERITDAIYAAGYSSSAQLYNQAAGTLGMTPKVYRSGGEGVEIRYTITACWLGWVLVAATPKGLCAIEFGDHPDELEITLKRRFPSAVFPAQDPQFNAWVKETLSFLERPGLALDLPLDIQGTAFQHKVWQALRQVPFGEQLSYSELAARIGQPTAARAVAQACGANRLAVAVPCHRVVRGTGELGGYRWGVKRKQLLLEREQKTA